MARLDISIEHGQPQELVHSKFLEAIHEAEDQFRNWIQRVDWSDDQSTATFTGSNYQVKFWYDNRKVHAQGMIPIAWKLLEGLARSHMKKIIDRLS